MDTRAEHWKQALASRHVVDPATGCWLWTGTVNDWGYGQINLVDGGVERHWQAHRLSYLVETGIEPETLHHLCGVKRCINPQHLLSTTFREHQRIHNRLDTCRAGHSLTDPENVYVRPDGGRQCKTCRRKYLRAWKRRQGEVRDG